MAGKGSAAGDPKKATKGQKAEKKKGGSCAGCCLKLLAVVAVGVAMLAARSGFIVWWVPNDEDIFRFNKAFDGVKGNDQHRAEDEGEVARAFYNLANEFYEYGWGDSFHFGFRRRSEPHHRAIANSQNFVAQRLYVGDMDKVLDMGCGIGGPMRGVVRATGANVTGITINPYQIKRGREITAGLTPWMQARCHFALQDYLNIQGLEENSYDAAFYMESSLHCENRTQTFKEAFKLLKPGGRLVAMEYVTIAGWQPEDPKHQELMRLHLHGNGAARTPSIEEAVSMVEAAGFKVKEHFDFMELGEQIYGSDNWPWWADLQPHVPDPRRLLLPAHPAIRWWQPPLMAFLARVGIIEENLAVTAKVMNQGADGLSGLGQLGAITPQYYIGAVKPAK